MVPISTHPKILPAHRERLALIYVRQSTLTQVRYHTGSTARQYDLVSIRKLRGRTEYGRKRTGPRPTSSGLSCTSAA